MTVERGDLNLRADLDKTFRLVAAVSGMEEPPAIKGQLSLQAAASGAGGGQQICGTGTIKQFVVGTGEEAITEEQVDLTLDARIDPKTAVLTLGENRVKSKGLTLDVKGKIEDYSGRAVADLTGSYDLSWPTVTALLARARARNARPDQRRGHQQQSDRVQWSAQ